MMFYPETSSAIIPIQEFLFIQPEAREKTEAELLDYWERRFPELLGLARQACKHGSPLLPTPTGLAILMPALLPYGHDARIDRRGYAAQNALELGIALEPDCLWFLSLPEARAARGSFSKRFWYANEHLELLKLATVKQASPACCSPPAAN